MKERRALGKNRRQRERRAAKPGSTTRYGDKATMIGGSDYVPKRIRYEIIEREARAKKKAGA